MSRNVKAVTTNIDGEETLGLRIGEPRLKLLLRAISREEFTSMWNLGLIVDDIAEKLDITSSDASNLRLYWKLERTRTVRMLHQREPIDLDILAKRLFDYIEPKLQRMIEEQVHQRDKTNGRIEENL